jgi:hypothetical protein
MRLGKARLDPATVSGEPGTGKPRRRQGRGWGPFSGGQLTIIVVAIAAMFAIPTAALAAAGAFTNNSATVPAVKGTNSNAHGIGVKGTGTKYGVYSDGPMGVAAGKPLNCSGCVGGGAIAPNARSLSRAYSGSGSVVLSNTSESQVASFLVPAGNYLINWSAQFWASASVANGVCYVELGDDALTQYDMAETGLAAAFPPGTLRGAAASTDVIENVAAGHASLHCFANVNSTHVTGSLTMVKVGAVSQ